MKLTDQHKKWLWIAGIALVLIHFTPHILAIIVRVLHPAPAVIPKPPAAIVAPAQPVAPVVPLVDPQIARTMGFWAGQSVRPDEAKSCMLHLELKPTPVKDADYTGYLTMSCGPTLALMANRMSQSGEARAILTQMMPVSSILSGPVLNGSITLHADQIIGAPKGCTTPDLTLTPFGENNLAAKWQETPDTCHGGDRHSRIQTTLDLYTQTDGDEARIAQGLYLEALGLASRMVQ